MNTTTSTSPVPRVYPHELTRQGGEWLGAARSWIQRKFRNGEHVTWGSQDWLEGGAPLTVDLIEDLAATVAAAAINEYAATAARECAQELCESERDTARLKWAMDHPDEFAALMNGAKWGPDGAENTARARLTIDIARVQTLYA